MNAQRGHALLDSLLGLGLGLLILQALLEVLACAQQAARQQRLLARQLQAGAAADTLLRAVVAASGRRGAPDQPPAPASVPQAWLRMRADARGLRLHSAFVADATPGACGEAPSRTPVRRAYRVSPGGAGKLRCALDEHPAQPMVEAITAWDARLLEARGPEAAPRWRRVAAAEGVDGVDWRRVELLQLRLSGARAPAPAGPAAECWIALPALGWEPAA